MIEKGSDPNGTSLIQHALLGLAPPNPAQLWLRAVDQLSLSKCHSGQTPFPLGLAWPGFVAINASSLLMKWHDRRDSGVAVFILFLDYPRISSQ